MEKELTPEQEKERAEKARAENVKNTLEWKLMQYSIGSNGVRNNQGDWGKFGVQSAETFYNQAMSGEDAQKKRSEIAQAKNQEYKKYNVYGDASATNQDVSLALAKQLEEVMTIAKFGEIEKYSKDIAEKLEGSKLDFQVPEDMKDYSIAKLMQKYADKKTGAVDLSKLSESDKEAYMFYENVLSKVYQRACEASAASKGDYFADINALAKQFGEKYQLPKEENNREE